MQRPSKLPFMKAEPNHSIAQKAAAKQRSVRKWGLEGMVLSN